LNAQSGGKETLSLDGRWEIIFDHNNEGKREHWHLRENFDKTEKIRDITVPSGWEIIEQDYEGVAFYRNTFHVPDHWENKVIRLQFGAVNYLAEVWMNDEVVGFHEGGFTPFEFRVDEMIKPGETNTLTMRVVGPIFLTGKRIDGMGKLEMPTWRGGITGGIWQSVYLVATGDTYIKDVFIQPDINDNTALFQVEVDQTAIEGVSSQLEIVINQNGSDSEPVVLTENWRLIPGINHQSLMLEIPDAGYWSPGNPVLYHASLRILSGGQVSDQWSTNFGMRELTIRDNDFYLNGKPILIKAAFFEGLYPNGIAYPDSEEMARKEIRLAKEAGFNMIRPWRHPPAPMWLDLTDEMGVMVVGSPALECMQLPLSTPYLPSRVENEVTQAILRDRNRACIVQWELFNELHRPVLKQMMRPMALLARNLDPTRLILDESGGWAYGANMYLPRDTEPAKFNDIHTYPGPFIDRNLFDGFLAVGMTETEKKEKGLYAKAPGRNVVPGLMSFISELGYGSLPDLVKNNELFESRGNPLTPAYRYHKRLAAEQEEVLVESGFKHLYPDMSQFYLDQQYIHGEANRRMVEATRSNPEVDGYCIHALVAGDWILGAGLLDLWRNPKTHAYEATKAVNQPQILSIRTMPRNVYAGQGTTLEVKGINELEMMKGKLDIQIIDRSGKVVFHKGVKTTLEQGVNSLYQEKISTDDLRGNYEVKAQLWSADKMLIAENTIQFDVFTSNDLAIPETRIAVMDPIGSLTGFLTSAGINNMKFSEDTHLSDPVLVAGYTSDDDSGDPPLEDLLSFVRAGGTAVFLKELSTELLDRDSLLPFSATPHKARGLWTCIPHLVRDHPLFAGLPSGKMMHDIYENVWTVNTLRELHGEEITHYDPVVAAVGFDWFSRQHKMHYSGPGTSWWGTDVAVLTLGKGRIIVSQLRLLNNLGKDPVADKILYNMINYATKP